MLRPGCSKSEASPVACPSVQGKELSPPLVLLVEILRYAPANLRQGAAHDFAKVALENTG